MVPIRLHAVIRGRLGRLIPFFVIMAGILVGCDPFGPKSSSNELMLVTYNVQNLFDAVETGSEYDEYTLEGGWSADAYGKRLERTARAITQGHGRVPDIVLLQEVENAKVVEDLLVGPLASRGYGWYATTGDVQSATQCAVLSRYPIVEARVHGSMAPRSVLEVHIDTEFGSLVVFALHAKSRLEGVAETEPLRVAMAESVSMRVKQLLKSNALLPIVVAGDFNGSPEDFYRAEGRYATAMVPVTVQDAYRHKEMGSLVVGGLAPADGCWYSWWMDDSQNVIAPVPGSYWYKGMWETYDQILLSPAFFDGYGLEFSEGSVVASPSLLDGEGHPFKWNVVLQEGVSDHLPIAVVLTGR
jgi:endonuclease/exonuclease/phosphatase family metal-dependent hydrolase